MPWILLPAKSFSLAKSRLSPALDENMRERLSAALLVHALETAKAAFPEAPIIVTTTDATVARVALNSGADRVFSAPRSGLNYELRQAACIVPGDADLLVFHTDLPLLVPEDLRAMAHAEGDVVIGHDTSGRGTNALLLRRSFRHFAFGADSCRRHAEGALAAGLEPRKLYRPGLARDLDSPQDLADLALSLDDLVLQLGRGGLYQHLSYDAKRTFQCLARLF